MSVDAESPLRRELRATLRLAFPLIVLQMAQSAIGAVGTAIVGRVSETDQAVVGLGNALYFAVTVLGLGLVLGFDPLLAQAVGAGEQRRARGLCAQAGFMSFMAGVPLALVVLGIAFAIPAFWITDGTGPIYRDYLLARLPSLFPFLAAAAARAYLQAVDFTRPLVWSALVANAVNAPLAWWLGIELGYGAVGTGWAVTAANFAMALVLLLSVRRRLAAAEQTAAGRAEHVPPTRRPERATLVRALRLGLPLGLQLFAEVGVFTIVTVLCRVMGERTIAAHHVALTLASTSFQVTLAIGAAAAVRVGHNIGAAPEHVAGAEVDRGPRRAGFVAFGAGMLFMVVASLTFLLFPGPLARVLTADPDVVAAAVPLIGIAAGFQLVDGAQAIGAGALRGAGDTKMTFWANALGHYGVGLPLGLFLAFGLDLGARGLWWGLSSGLAAVAFALVWRFHRLSLRPMARV